MAIENTKNKRGFTIIEVVLVLAIAGLIFLMVFIALPALQRSQRNTQRRDDYSMLVTAINTYMASNNGKIQNLYNRTQGGETDGVSLNPARWVNSDGLDPNGNPYEVIAIGAEGFIGKGKVPEGVIKSKAAYCKSNESANSQQCPSEDWVEAAAGEPGSQVYVIVKANCNGSDSNGDPEPEEDTAVRSFAVYGYLEGGGYFCQASGSNGSVQKNQ